MRLVHCRDFPSQPSLGHQPAIFQGETCPQVFSKGNLVMSLYECMPLGSYREAGKNSRKSPQMLSMVPSLSSETILYRGGCNPKRSGDVAKWEGIGDMDKKDEVIKKYTF